MICHAPERMHKNAFGVVALNKKLQKKKEKREETDAQNWG